MADRDIADTRQAIAQIGNCEDLSPQTRNSLMRAMEMVLACARPGALDDDEPPQRDVQFIEVGPS